MFRKFDLWGCPVEIVGALGSATVASYSGLNRSFVAGYNCEDPPIEADEGGSCDGCDGGGGSTFRGGGGNVSCRGQTGVEGDASPAERADAAPAPAPAPAHMRTTALPSTSPAGSPGSIPARWPAVEEAAAAAADMQGKHKPGQEARGKITLTAAEFAKRQSAMYDEVSKSSMGWATGTPHCRV